MGLFQELNIEHQKILEFLDCFSEMLSEEFIGKEVEKVFYLKAFSFIENYLDQIHHQKEEDCLFPEVHKMGIAKGGGPQCSLFFGLFLEQDFLNKIKSEIVSTDNIPLYRPRKGVQKIFEEKSPLEIPLKDHEAGYYALRILKKELDRRDKNLWDRQKFCRVGRWYISMLQYHIRKEEECLFVRLKQVLTEEQIGRLDLWARDFNEANQFKVEQAMDDLLSLKRLFSVEIKGGSG